MTLYCINPPPPARCDPIGHALRSIVYPVDRKMPAAIEQQLERLGQRTIASPPPDLRSSREGARR